MRRIMLAIALALGCAHLASADEIVSSSALDARIAGAQAAIITAYELPARGGMTDALSTLCSRGGRGDIILAGDSFIIGSRVRESVDEATSSLTAAGCHVRRATIPLHLKLAAVDQATYLADRNFGRSATILRDDDPADRSLIAATLRNMPGSNGTLATLKGQALAIEARTIADSSGSLIVESESFGANNPVYDAILAAAQQRRPVRLIVAASELRSEATERDSLDVLARAGVQIRAGSSDAKLAVADSPTFWIGSSNATGGYPDQIDWGKRLSDGALRQTIRARFEDDWMRADPI